MADPAGLDRLVRRVAVEVRLRRAEYYGLRGLFWGALLAVLPLLAKSAIGAAAPLVAGGLIAAGVGAGGILGLSLAAPRPDAARPAERGFGLQDRAALCKDTALSRERPDFSAFLKKGDERLRLLEQVDSLPDLQSDFTQSQYQKLAQQSKALTAGLRPDQIPPEKLRELLEQMEQ